MVHILYYVKHALVPYSWSTTSHDELLFVPASDAASSCFQTPPVRASRRTDDDEKKTHDGGVRKERQCRVTSRRPDAQKESSSREEGVKILWTSCNRPPDVFERRTKGFGTGRMSFEGPRSDFLNPHRAEAGQKAMNTWLFMHTASSSRSYRLI